MLAEMWGLLLTLWIVRLASGTLSLPLIAFAAVVQLPVLFSTEAVRRRVAPSYIDGLRPILVRVWMSYAVVGAGGALLGASPSRTLVWAALLASIVLPTARSLGRWGEERGRPPSRAVVIGAGDIARRLISTLQTRDEYRFEVVGALDDQPMLSRDALGVPILGGIADLPDIVDSRRVDVVLVAFPGGRREADWVDAVRSVAARGATVWVVPRLYELNGIGADADHVWGVPVVPLQAAPQQQPEWGLKRAFDVAVAGLLLLLLAPAFAVIAAAVWLDMGRPIFFSQARVGRGERPFLMFKFRSMRPRDGADETEWAPDEERITRVGRILRKTTLDELPQLVNVLRGEMSLIGPRPERPYFAHTFADLYSNYALRHRVSPGMSGWAQVHGLRGDTSIEDRALFDNQYIDGWRFSNDLKIACKTIPHVLGLKERKRGK